MGRKVPKRITLPPFSSSWPGFNWPQTSLCGEQSRNFTVRISPEGRPVYSPDLMEEGSCVLARMHRTAMQAAESVCSVKADVERLPGK